VSLFTVADATPVRRAVQPLRQAPTRDMTPHPAHKPAAGFTRDAAHGTAHEVEPDDLTLV
jgi:hypothetical protein